MVEWSQEHEVLDEHQEHHDDITQEHLDLGDFMDEIQILKDRKMENRLMNKNVQGLERNTYRFERNLRFSEKKRLVGQSFSKSGKLDKDSPIYRLPKEERVSWSNSIPDRAAARSNSLFDRLACSIRLPCSIGLPGFWVFRDDFWYFEFDERWFEDDRIPNQITFSPNYYI